MKALITSCVDNPGTVGKVMAVVSLLFVLIVTLPSLWPHTFPLLHPLVVDTDPENMLPVDEPVRVFHNQMKKEFALHDMVVVGVVNDAHPEGVFNPQSLQKIFELTQYAKTFSWRDKENKEKQVGVIGVDVIATSTVDNIEQVSPGVIRFDWLMPEPPGSAAEALQIRERAQRIPFLNGTLLSENGRALALYLPITTKDISYKVANKLRKKIAGFGGEERFLITGLPVAEDTFGVEMFIQMAICAPMAMLVIFLLMVYFFRKVALVAAAMAVAMVAVICSMGLLIGTGNTLHIMSSMIPIFIMPIAVLDSIHILSEFFDRYPEIKDRRKTILEVMDTLFKPMLFTSLTTAAGFASLALTPIPPVQVFGLFIAIGVMVAWLVSITFVPAVVMMMSPTALEDYGLAASGEGKGRAGSLVGRMLQWAGGATYRNCRLILIGALAVTVLAVYGITKIQINDNPVKWFAPSHEIRVADRVLNQHFGGTYMAYLALIAGDSETDINQDIEGMSQRLNAYESAMGSRMPGADAAFNALRESIGVVSLTIGDKTAYLNALEQQLNTFRSNAENVDRNAWNDALRFIDEERQRDHVFKKPEALRYVQKLQEHLAKTGLVGKSNSVVDIVRTIHRDLRSGREEYFTIPDSAAGVAQTMLTFQSSHRPRDLWHLITPDYRKANIWVQLKSGDNKDMSYVVQEIDRFVAENPAPFSIQHNWFGLTYLNVVWQEKMVSGMLMAFLGSFIVVWMMMAFLFRSVLWGLLCLIPLMVTIGSIYGIIGLIGKDYDMPIAVLSALSLGLAVDYAIHFAARARMLQQRHGSWKDTVAPLFAEPARAISRNAIVNGVGFLPLLLAPLVPYQTVGVFIAAILFTAGVATLVILPALVKVLQGRLFPA